MDSSIIFNNKNIYDFIVKSEIDEGELYLHKSIFISYSPFFQNLLLGTMESIEKQQSSLTFPERFEVLKQCFEILYNSHDKSKQKAMLDYKFAGDIYKVAHRLQLQTVVDIADEVLASSADKLGDGIFAIIQEFHLYPTSAAYLRFIEYYALQVIQRQKKEEDLHLIVEWSSDAIILLLKSLLASAARAHIYINERELALCAVHYWANGYAKVLMHTNTYIQHACTHTRTTTGINL